MGGTADTVDAAAAAEETTVKKSYKEIREEQLRKEAEKEVIKPEISSFLKNFIKKEGESLEFKCRLEEDYEEGEVKMTWHFNGEVIESGDRYMITFDGTYATLFIASCVMADMGEYKVVFENSAGVDETTGKVTVKPRDVPKPQDKPKKEVKEEEPKP